MFPMINGFINNNLRIVIKYTKVIKCRSVQLLVKG